MFIIDLCYSFCEVLGLISYILRIHYIIVFVRSWELISYILIWLNDYEILDNTNLVDSSTLANKDYVGNNYLEHDCHGLNGILRHF